MIDFTDFDRVDREEATKLGYQLVEAMKSDAVRARFKFKVSPYGKKIHETMGLGNSQAFNRLTTIGRKLTFGTELNQGDYPVSGSDLAKIIVYVLSNDAEKFPTFREVLSKPKNEFSELNDIADSYDPVVAHAKHVLSQINPTSPDLARQLIEIAQVVNEYETSLFEMSRKLEDQNLTILKTVKENTQLAKDLDTIRQVFLRMESLIKGEADPMEKQKLIDKYNEFKARFENGPK